VDRLDDITYKFPKALELCCHRGHVIKALCEHVDSIEDDNDDEGGRMIKEPLDMPGGIKSLLQCDTSAEAVGVARNKAESLLAGGKYALTCSSEQADDEDVCSHFEDASFDLVLSNMGMHWINDLPSALRRIKRILKPDGALVGCMLGGQTLQELRHCIYLAEQERRGGVAPHTSPLALASDVASLLQGAGLALPTVDVDTVSVGYPDAFSLMRHVVCMGEGMATYDRQAFIGLDTMLAAAAHYQRDFAAEDGSVYATFQLVHFIGWGPDADKQQQPLQRGSAGASLKDLSTGGRGL
jgi:NADH dehydrogenase [ubiquinone] 1 alpha subcomplex assembly factor 5